MRVFECFKPDASKSSASVIVPLAQQSNTVEVESAAHSADEGASDSEAPRRQLPVHARGPKADPSLHAGFYNSKNSSISIQKDSLTIRLCGRL